MATSSVEVMPDQARGWMPKTVAQKAALDSEADILLLGGAAGSLKTSTILVDLIQERDYPRMNSYFFRRTYPELEDAMQQAADLFPQTGARHTENHTYIWPSGAHFRFRHLQHEKNLYENQGKAMSAIGADESTHVPMNWIRYLMSRNRSTDPNLSIRVRLGTNPGNIGHKDHMKMFFNGVCPHCEPDKAPPQNTLRWDAKWHDGTPLSDPTSNTKLSIAYILSYVRDHNILGDGYIARLKMQSPTTAKALLEGCWKLFAGQFFDVWEPDRGRNIIERGAIPPPGCGPMVMARSEIRDQWWWPRWVASDYGFSISCSAAHLFIHEPASDGYPRGRVYVVAEDICQESAADFAQRLVDQWVLDDEHKPIERRWMPWYLSHDSFREIGVPFTLASQMNGVLGKYGLNFVRANNERPGGWMKIYTGLQTGELVICRDCPRTIEALETRIHDDKKENDIKKVSGDEIDDIIDSLRYGYMSFETARGVTAPLNIRIAERIGDLYKIDPTNAMVQLSKIMEEEKAKGSPTVYAGSARQRMQNMRR